jgi:hypothetical protein
MRRVPAQAPMPVNCLKPKVFIGRTSIRQLRALAEKFTEARASAKAEFAMQKGEALSACPFGNSILSRAAIVGKPFN